MLITGDKKTDQKLWRDVKWSREHSQELHDNYERMWVAIYDRQIVASDKNPRIVEKIALEKTGVSRKELYLIYVEDSRALYRQTYKPKSSLGKYVRRSNFQIRLINQNQWR